MTCVSGSINENWLSRWVSSLPNPVTNANYLKTSTPRLVHEDCATHADKGTVQRWDGLDNSPDELESLVDGATAEQKTEHETKSILQSSTGTAQHFPDVLLQCFNQMTRCECTG